MTDRTDAEEWIEMISQALDEIHFELDVKREAGIVTIIFPDGSYLNFTEPQAFPKKKSAPDIEE